ncbi:MAG TPA: hypothetical protein VFH73_28590 [Polyangia bacterium]|nr:hypothetical protein [Polyangia bacterium]
MAQGAFAACSLVCLNKHLAAAHALQEPFDSAARFADYLRYVNQQRAGTRERYQEHRERVMALVSGAGAGDIAIFGAGNGSDLDLEQLASVFREIHLVDMDGEALEGARQALPSDTRKKVVLHAPVDLSGFTSRLDEWGENFPDDSTLGQAAVAAAWDIVGFLMQKRENPFDVVLSAGVLSQLTIPFLRACVTTRANWGRLSGAVTALHLATLSGSLRSGGLGVLVVDVLSTKTAAGLRALVGRGADELEAYVGREAAAGAITLQPDPGTLLKQMQSPGLQVLIQNPSLTAPWLWNLGDAIQLVYGLQFLRP